MEGHLDQVCPTVAYCRQHFGQGGGGATTVYFEKNLDIVFTPDFSTYSYDTYTFDIINDPLSPLPKESNQYLITCQLQLEVVTSETPMPEIISVIQELVLLCFTGNGEMYSTSSNKNPGIAKPTYRGQVSTDRNLVSFDYSGTLDLTDQDAFVLKGAVRVIKKLGYPEILRIIWPDSFINFWMSYMPLKVNP